MTPAAKEQAWADAAAEARDRTPGKGDGHDQRRPEEPTGQREEHAPAIEGKAIGRAIQAPRMDEESQRDRQVPLRRRGLVD